MQLLEAESLRLCPCGPEEQPQRWISPLSREKNVCKECTSLCTENPFSQLCQFSFTVVNTKKIQTAILSNEWQFRLQAFLKVRMKIPADAEFLRRAYCNNRLDYSSKCKEQTTFSMQYVQIHIYHTLHCLTEISTSRKKKTTTQKAYIACIWLELVLFPNMIT